MRTPKIKIKEKDLQHSLLEWLGYQKIFHYRNNSGAVISEYKGKKRFMRFGAVGSPDIVCVIKGQFVGVEVKGTGGKQSDDQKDFQERLEKAGGVYIVGCDFNEITKQLKCINS